MKWVSLSLTLILVVILGVFLLKDRPSIYYQEILNGNDPIPTYFKGGELGPKILQTKPYKIERAVVIYEEQEKYWKKFHLSHFELEVPYDHPLYYPVPIVEPTNFAPNVGLNFYDSLGKFILSFTILTPISLRYFSIKDKIFNYPVTENYLNNLDRKKIWEDLFSLNIPKSCSTCSLLNSVYYLYIIRLRQEYFKFNFDEIQFYKEKKTGVLIFSDKNKNFEEETLLYLNDGFIYPIKLRIQKNNPQAEITRRRIVKSFSLKASQKDARVPIFAEYQNMPLSEQKGLKSIYFLFSAWTHDQENENYFKLLIKNLESFKPQDQSYHPLYEFSFKKFGSTFSRYGDTFQETMERKLRRKIEEELQTEIENSKLIEIKAPIENFKSGLEKQEYYLKEAKEKKIKDDQGELTID